MIWLAVAGFLSGMISGMGMGGGTILIPVLAVFTDLSQQGMQGINLVYFIPTAIIALIRHIKNDNIEKNVVKPLVVFGLVGAVIGSFAAVAFEGEMLKKLFAVFLGITGIRELIKK